MTSFQQNILGSVVVLSGALVMHLFAQGPLTPPGAPAPTMKTLDQVEPRIPIVSLPFNITAPGSYYLTSNVTGGSGTAGITIRANDVTLDLMGFEMMGVSGTSNGVDVNEQSNVTIKNGSVRSWGGDGVDAQLASNCLFQDLLLTQNGSVGLHIGSNSIGLHCIAVRNGGSGIDVSSGSIVRECTANSNTGRGIGAGSSTVENCVASRNTGDGINVFTNCVVKENQCISNGLNSGSGVGIHVNSPGNRIEGNHVVGNDRGIDVDSRGNVIIHNSARANGSPFLINYSIVSGNQVEPIGNASAATSPWANFSF